MDKLTGLFYTINPVFYTSGNRFVCRTGTFGNLIFSLVPSDNRNTRSTCPTSVFTGIGQTLMSRPASNHPSTSQTNLKIKKDNCSNLVIWTSTMTNIRIQKLFLLLVTSFFYLTNKETAKDECVITFLDNFIFSA